jgi:hypothetical protein
MYGLGDFPGILILPDGPKRFKRKLIITIGFKINRKLNARGIRV